MGMPAPDFYLVGAPKCATSSLHALLIQHPGVFMCRPKEPHFFCTDLPGLAEVPDRAAYDALFADAPEGALRGEASAFYLMSAEAPAAIKAANPDARIILSIRNPADAARSLYHQLRDGFREDQTTFEAAWALQEARGRGESLPSYCPEPRQLQYQEVYSYADQVARYLDVFGPEQTLILRFDEISKTPEAVVDRVVDFLGLPPFETPVTLPQKNTRRQPRARWLSQLLASPPPVLRPLVAPVKGALNAMGIKPSVVMMKYLSKPAAKPASGPAADTSPAGVDSVRAEVVAAFAEDVARLEQILGEDLSAWR